MGGHQHVARAHHAGDLEWVAFAAERNLLRAVLQLMPGRDGLLHISQISHERVNAVSDHLKEGQIVKVKVLEADDKGRVRLSMKAVKDQQEQPAKQNS